MVRLRNLDNITIIAEYENGHREEVSKEFVEGIIKELDENIPKYLGSKDVGNFLLKQRLLNLLEVPNFEVVL